MVLSFFLSDKRTSKVQFKEAAKNVDIKCCIHNINVSLLLLYSTFLSPLSLLYFFHMEMYSSFSYFPHSTFLITGHDGGVSLGLRLCTGSGDCFI